MKVLIGAVLATLALAAPAAAAEKTVTIPSDGPGPRGVRPRRRPPVRPEEGRARPRAHARDLGRRRRLHADRPRADREGAEARRLGDRPPQPGARGHGDVRARERRPGVAAGDVRLLPRLDRERRHAGDPLQLPRRERPPVRARVGNGDDARGRPQGRARRRQGRARRDPRRALARRLARRRLRRLGLQRQAGLRGPLRDRDDRRRTARQLRRLRPRAGAGRRSPSSRPATRSPTCSGSGSPRRRACSPRSAASTRSSRRTRARRRCRRSHCCPTRSTRASR